jgi:hypothetical protein
LRRLVALSAAALLTYALFVPLAPGAAATGPVGSLQATIDTSLWVPPSPDPMGVTWWGAKGRLLVVDSEVDEMPAYYKGANVFEATTSGGVVGTSDTTSYSNEPTDVAANGQYVYMTDDDKDRVFVIDVGPDGDLNTGDDSQDFFGTRAFGSYDPEAISYANGVLFLGDGVNTQIYRVDPGSDAEFGGSDDRVTCFDTAALGMQDPEGVAVDPGTGHTYVVSPFDREIAVADPTGALVDLIDLRGVLPFGPGTPINPSGLALAPASDDPSRTDLYVADRAVDNNADPTENDGKIYEVKRTAAAGNVAPVVSGLGQLQSVEGEDVLVLAAAADPNGDTLSYGASGLPPGLSIDLNTGLISGTIDAGASGNYTGQLVVSDGSLPPTTRQVNWTVGVGSPADEPPVIDPIGDRTSTAGDVVSFQVEANDPDPGQALMYSATGLPPGLWLECSSGLIKGTIDPSAASGSPYTVHVKVEDQTVPDDAKFVGKWDTETFTWIVNPVSGGGGGGGGGGVVLPGAAISSPKGLTITPTSVGLALDWEDNSETNLAGYHVYRVEPSGWLQLDNPLLETSAFLDRTAPAGVRSTYRVVAVDGGGLESAPTEGSAVRSAIAFRSASSAAVESSKRVRIRTPKGAMEGDVLVAAIDVVGRARVEAPAGWTEVMVDRERPLRQLVFVHVVGSDEPRAWRWQLSRPRSAAGAIVAYEGVDTAEPVANSGGRARDASVTIVAPSLTASTPSALLVGMFGVSARARIAPPAGMLEQEEVRVADGRWRIATEISDQVLEEVGSTGRRKATASRAGVNIGQVLILLPAS